MTNKQSRVFSIKEQIKNIYYGSKGFVLLRTSRKKKLMNKKFKERIMLAITEVNGCAMCSYVHTKLALSSGMTAENIKNILDGDSTSIPENEAVAVLFSQEFASLKENPSDSSVDRLIKEYGINKAEIILAACNMITMTNGMGISLDNLYNRIKFNRNKKSNIINELLNPFFTMLLFPSFVIFFYIYSVFSSIHTISNKKLIAN